MLKKVIYTSMFIFIIIIFVLFSKFILMKLDSNSNDNERKYAHHVRIITHEKDSNFYYCFKNGIDDASDNYNILAEIVYVEKDDIDSFKAQYEKALFSGVEDLAFQSIDNDEINRLVDDSFKRYVGVVSYENGYNQIGKVPFIGTNNYNKGKELANMAMNARNKDEKTNYLVFLDKTENSSLIAQGIKTTIGEPNNIIFCNVDGNTFDINKQTKATLKEHEKDDINCIICTKQEYTHIVGQYIIDKNEVGKTTIIGYGNSNETSKMVSNGVISGTLCPNGYEIGYSIVEQINNNIQSKNMSSVSTTMYSLTKKDLSISLDNLEDKYLNLEKMYFDKK